MPDALVFRFRDQPAAQFQAEELSWIEHFTVAGIAPSMQASRFVARRDLLVGDKAGRHLLPSPCRGGNARDVFCIGLLEKAALVLGFSFGVVVLDREEAVVKRPLGATGIGIGMTAVRAIASAAASGSGPDEVRPRRLCNLRGSYGLRLR